MERGDASCFVVFLPVVFFRVAATFFVLVVFVELGCFVGRFGVFLSVVFLGGVVSFFISAGFFWLARFTDCFKLFLPAVFFEGFLFVVFAAFLGVPDFPDFEVFFLLPLVFPVFLAIRIPVQAIIGLFAQCMQDFFYLFLKKLKDLYYSV